MILSLLVELTAAPPDADAKPTSVSCMECGQTFRTLLGLKVHTSRRHLHIQETTFKKTAPKPKEASAFTSSQEVFAPRPKAAGLLTS